VIDDYRAGILQARLIAHAEVLGTDVSQMD
jgi:hypothetical protein